MRYLKKYESFPVNEGKVSQFFLKGLLDAVDHIQRIIQKMRGIYIPFKFKDKRLDKKVSNQIMQIIDYTFFDALKMYFSKKYKQQAYKTSFSELIKSRSGVDLYRVCDSVLSDLKQENIILSDNEELKQKQIGKLNIMIDRIKKFKALIKKVDDNILEEQKFLRELAELGEMFKSLDSRNSDNLMRGRVETLSEFDKLQAKLDDMRSGKDIDVILDKIAEFGIDSLTTDELDTLNKYSVGMNEKVRFYDKEGRWFSSSNGLYGVEDHKKRFGDDITFSVDGVEKSFSSMEEYENFIKNNQVGSIFGDSESARKRVAEKRRKRINESNEQDPEFVFTKIKEQYSIDKAEEMYEKEILEWIPEGRDRIWYDEQNNGEAQDMVINQMIGWFEKNYYELSDENFEKVKSMIEKEYTFLMN